MSDRRVLPYGSWPSPITIDMVVAGATSLGAPRLPGDGVYWIEGRPEDRGRQVIVRSDSHGATRDLNPPPFNARTMTHEYGGGSYVVDAQRGMVYFSNVADGRIYRQGLDEGSEPVALTADGSHRFGDLVIDASHDRLVCIREDHSDAGREAVNELVAVAITDGAITVLASGYDFYSSPRPAGDRIAWMSWRHPNMPWDASELWVADVDAAGTLRNERMVAGSGGTESVIQPEWSGDSLVFISDRSVWWNLYRWMPATDETVALLPMEAEFGGAQWVFGMTWYGIAADGTIYATALRDGRAEIWRIAPGGEAVRVDLPDQTVGSLQVGPMRAGGPDVLCYVGGGPRSPSQVVVVEPGDGGSWSSPRRRVVREAFELDVPAEYLAAPEHIEFPTSDGQTAHALLYPPTNPEGAGPDSERPPLVVMIHGGPTSHAGTGLDLEKNAFTSRGFAVVDVDYRGSTGYGRDYMRSLDGQWGVYDVDDCVAAAQFLAARGDVDPARMVIRGGSAGGYTTLAALVFHDVFAAGASYYGVGDLEALARDTHKFESRYLDRLVAPYPEGVPLYRERSPIYHVEKLTRPLIVFQGEDDRVVPIAQAEQIVDALRRRRIPHAYLPFEGEGHGFRQAANMRRALEAELSFYAQVFGFELADDFEPVAVEYLNGE